MKTTTKGRPVFAYVEVELAPGESIYAESSAMANMSAELEMKAVFQGGFFTSLLRKIFAGESLFVNCFTNNTDKTLKINLVQTLPGDIQEMSLNDSSYYFQPGAYLCSEPGVEFHAKWAGFRSWFAREGLFRLEVRGKGRVWYGCYGATVEKEVNGEYLVDTGHIVGYPPSIRFRLQLAGGIFSSFFGGEGFVTRLEGKGVVILQTRSIGGLVSWLNPKLPR